MSATGRKALKVFCSYSHRDEEHLNDLRDSLRGLEREGALPPKIDVATFADMMWGLMGTGSYRNLVIERGWSRRI